MSYLFLLTKYSKTLDEHYFIREEDIHRWIYAKSAKHEQRQRRDGCVYLFSEGTVRFPEPLDRPTGIMLISETQVGRTSHVITDPYTGRFPVLMPVECERLNGFPGNWTNMGMPEKMGYFYMGNELVVPIVTRISSLLLLLINNFYFTGLNINRELLNSGILFRNRIT